MFQARNEFFELAKQIRKSKKRTKERKKEKTKEEKRVQFCKEPDPDLNRL
jgi:hypothetical protein